MSSRTLTPPPGARRGPTQPPSGWSAVRLANGVRVTSPAPTVRVATAAIGVPPARPLMPGMGVVTKPKGSLSLVGPVTGRAADRGLLGAARRGHQLQSGGAPTYPRPVSPAVTPRRSCTPTRSGQVALTPRPKDQDGGAAALLSLLPSSAAVHFSPRRFADKRAAVESVESNARSAIGAAEVEERDVLRSLASEERKVRADWRRAVEVVHAQERADLRAAEQDRRRRLGDMRDSRWGDIMRFALLSQSSLAFIESYVALGANSLEDYCRETSAQHSMTVVPSAHTPAMSHADVDERGEGTGEQAIPIAERSATAVSMVNGESKPEVAASSREPTIAQEVNALMRHDGAGTAVVQAAEDAMRAQLLAGVFRAIVADAVAGRVVSHPAFAAESVENEQIL